MAESDRLRDTILGVAFKAVVYDAALNRLSPEYGLSEYEGNELERIAQSDYGYSHQDFINYKQKVLGHRGVTTCREYELSMVAIGNGDIIEIEGPAGEILRLLKLQASDFLVLSDDSSDACPGDIMTMLQFCIAVDSPMYAQLRRGKNVVPAPGRVYAISKVCSLNIMRSDISLFCAYTQSASSSPEVMRSPEKAYANNFDLKFGGFTGLKLEPEQKGQLYEVDIQNMTYRLNPNFRPMPGLTYMEEIQAGFQVEGDGNDIYRLQPVADGKISLKPRDGFYVLYCEQPAIVSLC